MRRTAKEALDDDCLGMAAQLSYYFCLALFPALLFLLALSSFFSLDHLTDDVTAVLGPLVSPQIVSLIQEQMRRLADADDSGLMTVGVLGAMWGSSSALVGIVTAVNRAYDVQETRPWWKVRLISVALTFMLALLLIAAVSLIMAGPGLAAALGVPIQNEAWIWTWNGVRWPAAFALVAFAIGMVYNYAPDADQDWLWVTPGAVAATALWLVASVGFKFYVATFADYEGTYGAVGGIIILLLWLYISGLGILVGAELNSEIEHATAYGQTPLTNTVGRRVIGRRAGRLFDAREAARRADSAVRPAVPPGPRPHLLPGAVFASAVLILRGSRRMLRGRS